MIVQFLLIFGENKRRSWNVIVEIKLLLYTLVTNDIDDVRLREYFFAHLL